MGIIIGYSLLSLGSLGSWVYLRKKKRDWKYRNYLLMLAASGVLGLLGGVWDLTADSQREELVQLDRNEAGGGAVEVPLLLDADDLFQEYDYPVTVEEQLLTASEAEQIFAEARQELEQVILGENESPEQITSDLKVPGQLLDGLVEVSCSFEPYDLVDMDGAVLWENMRTEEELVKVSAEMYCQEREAVHEFYIRLTPQPLEGTEALFKELERRLEAENGSTGQEYLSLPEEVNGVRLNWHSPPEQTHAKLFLAGVICMVVWYVYEKEKQEREQKAWNRQLVLDYPDIVSQLSLLSGAGMTMSAAWARLACEYREQRESGKVFLRPGYEEMLKTWYEIQDGLGETKAYENFGRRCNQAQYRKFASMLIQNVRKGTRGMQQLLDAEAEEAFLQRKVLAKQLGEEAGTKLLIPMGLMLLLVFAILLMPAMLSLGV